jgi:integrase
MAGEIGLLKQLTKAILERALAAELTAHPGYEKHGAAARAVAGTAVTGPVQSVSRVILAPWRSRFHAARPGPRAVASRPSSCWLADNHLLAPDTAAAIERVPGVKQEGVRAGNWLLKEQASELLKAPDPMALKGKRDRAMLVLLVGCGLRRGAALARRRPDRAARRPLGHPDLAGKGNRRRPVPVPAADRSWTEKSDRSIRSMMVPWFGTARVMFNFKPGWVRPKI